MSAVIFEHISRNICRILLNRPAKRNAINFELYKQLREAIDQFEQDDSLNVAILGGMGGNFCSGYDLESIVDQQTARPNMPAIEQLLWPIGSRLSEKKITIAAIEGHAAGFGYELALKCDFRVADRDSRMGFLNRRFGIPIMNGGTVILPQLIGLARAAELVATGKAQLAHEALQYGILTHIADIGCSLGRATNLARCLVKFDQSALIHDLKSIHYSIGEQQSQIALLRAERERSLGHLARCASLEIAVKFIKGELCRHGNTDLGSILSLEPDLTL